MSADILSRDTEDVFLADSPVPMRKKLLLSRLSHSSMTWLLPRAGLGNKAGNSGKEKINVSNIESIEYTDTIIFLQQASREHASLLLVVLIFLLCHSIR